MGGVREGGPRGVRPNTARRKLMIDVIEEHEIDGRYNKYKNTQRRTIGAPRFDLRSPPLAKIGPFRFKFVLRLEGLIQCIYVDIH